MCVWNFFHSILEKKTMSFEFVCEIISGFFFFSGQVKSENIAQNNLSYWSAAKRTCGQTLRR